MVQVSQVLANGRPILPGDFESAWKYSDAYTTRPDFYQVDTHKDYTTPFYHDETRDRAGTSWGQVGYKIPGVGIKNATLLDGPSSYGGDKGFEPKRGGWRNVKYNMETFAFCKQGPDRNKWYEGVKWHYVQLAIRANKGDPGWSEISERNVATPSNHFLAAVALFNAWAFFGH